jgi:hypothetical protein
MRRIEERWPGKCLVITISILRALPLKHSGPPKSLKTVFLND